MTAGLDANAWWALGPATGVAWLTLVGLAWRTYRKLDAILDRWEDIPERVSALESEVADVSATLIQHLRDGGRHTDRRDATIDGTAPPGGRAP